MTTQPSAAVPRLIMLAPESFRGRQIELTTDYLTVGREPTCHVCLDDPHVSRTHAALQRRGGTVYVQDLGSSGGTFVNGNPTRRAELRQGDVVSFASVQARFEAAAPVTAETQAMPRQAEPGADTASPPTRSASPGGASVAAERPEPNPSEFQPAKQVRYDIGQQDAQVISNVARDQYNAHIQQVIQQRDSFLRDVARTKTKARWLVWLGLVLFVAGFALFAVADLNFLKQIASDIQSTSPPPPPSNPFGPPIFGIPSGLLGWAIAAIGAIMLLIGIVLHIVATSRRRRVERDYPIPLQWPPSGSLGRTR